MAGGKGGSTTSNVQVPEYIEEAAKRNLARADVISQIGYVPYYGPDVAAFTPTQEAAFQNVAGQAGAFGLSTPAGGAMAGMPAPQEFAGGIQGYSSAPLFEQAQADLAAKRPAQVNLMNSLFIDPFTGQVGTNVAAPIDYSQLGTVADIREADRQRDLAVAEMNMQGSALSAPEYNTYVNTIQEAIGDPTYNPATDFLTQSQIDAINQDQDAQLAQDAIYMNQLGNANATIGDAFTTLTGGEPSFDDPSGAGSYGGSLVTGELSTDLLGIPGLVGEVADNIYQKVDFEGAVEKQGENFAEAAGSTLQDDGTYDISNWFTDTSATPTIDVSNRPFGFETYEPTIGMPTPAPASANAQVAPVAGPDAIAYGGNLAEETGLILSDLSDEEFFAALESDPTLDPYINYGSSNDNDSYTPVPTTSSGATVIPTGTTIATGTVLNKADDPVVEVDGKLYNQSNAPAPAPAPSGGGGGGNDGGGGGGGVCVVATHAVNSGAFTPSMKREAVVWCMNVLHDKWWGEAIRRGYRHLGRKKIEQGKAHEHYQEFRDYIAFANGKKRTLKGAINFTLRTAQFFAVGLIKKEA
jgi:hypothetical protein